MRSAGIVLILCGVFVAAAVLHSKLASQSSSSASGSSGAGGGGAGSASAHSFTEALPGGGDITVNASDPAAAIANVQAETGMTPVGMLSGPGGSLVG